MWVKIDDQFPRHPKVVAAGGQAKLLYIDALCYSSCYLTDGFIAEAALPHVSTIRNPESAARRLEEVGLWDPVDGGWYIHDYHDYNPGAEMVKAERAAARKRMQLLRANRRRT